MATKKQGCLADTPLHMGSRAWAFEKVSVQGNPQPCFQTTCLRKIVFARKEVMEAVKPYTQGSSPAFWL
jgi:hypothetical protein